MRIHYFNVKPLIMNRIFYYFFIMLLVISCGQENSLDNQDSSKLSAYTFEDPPEWAAGVIWYQIFVERFRNGDPANDPTKEDIIGSYPGFIPETWSTTPWGHDWYEPDPYFAEMEGKSDYFGNPVSSFGQKAQLRRYGGDLQGVLDKIDYLDSLGVTAIYFNPLNDAPSLHKYDPRHWRHVDRNFGPNPEKDAELIAAEKPDDPSTWEFTEADRMFLRMIEAFHQRGIRVILDYSWNHTGHMFWAWQDLLENQEKSKFADWYWVKSFDDPETPENEFQYRGWAGTFGLPEIKETQAQDHLGPVQAFEGDIYSSEVKDHIYSITRRWLDPNGDGDPSDGVDGFRLDVAAEVPLDFWREYRKVVRDVNPEAYLLGEVWWEKWPDKLLDPEPYLRGDIFDAPMNYRWYRSARNFFNASPHEITATEFVDSLNRYRSNLRKQNNYAMMNMTASHDAPRLSTSLFNKNKYKYNCSPGGDINYKIHKPDETTFQTLRLLLAHQYTYIGAPQIWGGDEMGMWGADDPSSRKPLIWPDYQFNQEKAHPLNLERPNDDVAFNHDLFDYYRTLIDIRKTHPALSRGDLIFSVIDESNKVLAYRRFHGSDEVVVVFNVSHELKNIEVPVQTTRQFTDLLTGKKFESKGSKVFVSLSGRSVVILTRN